MHMLCYRENVYVYTEELETQSLKTQPLTRVKMQEKEHFL